MPSTSAALSRFAKGILVSAGLAGAASGLVLLGHTWLSTEEPKLRKLERVPVPRSENLPHTDRRMQAVAETKAAIEPAIEHARSRFIAMAAAALAAAYGRVDDSAEIPIIDSASELRSLLTSPEAIAQRDIEAVTLNAQLAAEPVDPGWASGVEDATRRAVARLGAGMRLEEVSCRQTLCRVRITHLDPTAQADQLEQLLSLPVIDEQAHALPSDGSTVLYFSRKGSPISVLQAASNDDAIQLQR